MVIYCCEVDVGDGDHAGGVSDVDDVVGDIDDISDISDISC